MTAAVRAIKPSTGTVNARDVLILRAWARAYLWHAGEYELHEAIDPLQHDAERDGLVEQYGQDTVQKILSDAFQIFQESNS